MHLVTVLSSLGELAIERLRPWHVILAGFTVVIHFLPGTFHFLTEPGIFAVQCIDLKQIQRYSHLH